MNLFMVQCPFCGDQDESHKLLLEWNEEGSYYISRCGHKFHLDKENGGAISWIVKSGEKTLPDGDSSISI